MCHFGLSAQVRATNRKMHGPHGGRLHYEHSRCFIADSRRGRVTTESAIGFSSAESAASAMLDHGVIALWKAEKAMKAMRTSVRSFFDVGSHLHSERRQKPGKTAKLLYQRTLGFLMIKALPLRIVNPKKP